LTGQAPWSDVWITGFGIDEKGEKMSKSKGNAIDPFPIIIQYGADAFRFWSASEGNLGYDFRCSQARIVSAQRFLSKLWNVARFISSFDIVQDCPTSLAPTDRWIIAELSKLIEVCNNGFVDFNFYTPANAIREFTWNLFASHYIEMVKGRFYDMADGDGQRSATFALHTCLSTILLLLAPICPFISEELWTRIYSNISVHSQGMPKSQMEDRVMTRYTKSIIDFNSMVWNKKKETISKETGKPLSLKDFIDIRVPVELDIFKKDLEVMHNLNT
jgi:valyl-tRNA synthetase